MNEEIESLKHSYRLLEEHRAALELRYKAAKKLIGDIEFIHADEVDERIEKEIEKMKKDK